MMQVNYFDITIPTDNPNFLLPVQLSHDHLNINVDSAVSLEDDVFYPLSEGSPHQNYFPYILYTQVPQLFRRDSTPSIITCQNNNGGARGLCLTSLPDLIPSPEPPRLMSDFEDDFGQRPVSESPSRLF